MVITTIEKRFGLRSRQTGLVASGYDIASFICLIPVTYFGGRTNSSKSRIIAIGLLLLGLGSLVFSIPHFLVGHYRVTAAETNTCSVQTNAVNATIFQVCINTKLYKKTVCKLHPVIYILFVWRSMRMKEIQME